MKVRVGWRAGLAAAAACLAVPGAAAAWTVSPSPNAFSGNNALNAVSATSASDVWAVGYDAGAARHSGKGTLTEHWDGLAWSIVPSPDSLLNDDVLEGVAAISPSDAWAVGETNQISFRSRTPLLVHWNGKAWSTVGAPSGLTGELRAVSATGSSDVWAVGDDRAGHGVVLHYNGSSWSRAAVPTPATGDVLMGVTAISPTNVWAVGARFPNCDVNPTTTVTLHYNGAAWSIVPSPNPDSAANALTAVAASGPTNVWAVGCRHLDETTTGVPPGSRTLIVHWTGSGWSVASSPNTGDNDLLTGVAVPETHAAAVGHDENRTGPIPIDRTLTEQWSGTSWSIVASPNVGSNDNLINGVTAVRGAPGMWAVGFHLTTPGGPYQTLILHS